MCGLQIRSIILERVMSPLLKACKYFIYKKWSNKEIRKHNVVTTYFV